MVEPSNLIINGINLFINKFNTATDILELDIIKENFKLDRGETGLTSVFLSRKKKTSTIELNGTTHTVKTTDLMRSGKLIHKKVTLIPHEET